MDRMRQWAAIGLLVIAGALGGCGARQMYRDEAFDAETPFSRRMSGSQTAVCESVKRALLMQGYVLETQTEPQTLVGTKAFQRDEEMITLRLRTTCLGNNDGTHTVFAAAQEEVSELQPIKQPSGINIGGFGVTVPSGSARIPALVKRETVQDPQFYARFYALVETLIAKLPK